MKGLLGKRGRMIKNSNSERKAALAIGTLQRRAHVPGVCTFVRVGVCGRGMSGELGATPVRSADIAGDSSALCG